MTKQLNLAKQKLVLPPQHIYAYHRTRNEHSPYSIAYNGFDLQLAGRNGTMYGKGFYLARELAGHLHRGNYGHVVIKSMVDMRNVLILDLPLAIKVWGVPKTLWQQLGERGLKFSATQAGTLRDYSKTCANFGTYRNSSEVAKLLVDSPDLLNLPQWSGIAYTGTQDGPCVVMYQTELVLPISWLIIPPNIKFVAGKKIDADDDDDDEDEKNKKMDVRQFIQSAEWKMLSLREVQRVRSGFHSRFVRWLTQFKKLPRHTAQRRFNLMFGSLHHEYLGMLLDDITKFANTDKSDTSFVKKLLKNLSPEALQNFSKNLVTDYTTTKKNIDKIKQLLEKMQYPIFQTILPKIYEPFCQNFIDHFLEKAYATFAAEGDLYVNICNMAKLLDGFSELENLWDIGSGPLEAVSREYGSGLSDYAKLKICEMLFNIIRHPQLENRFDLGAWVMDLIQEHWSNSLPKYKIASPVTDDYEIPISEIRKQRHQIYDLEGKIDLIDRKKVSLRKKAKLNLRLDDDEEEEDNDIEEDDDD